MSGERIIITGDEKSTINSTGPVGTSRDHKPDDMAVGETEQKPV
jgi:hypothetical protein